MNPQWLSVQICMLAFFNPPGSGKGGEGVARSPMVHAPRYADHTRLLVVRDGSGRELPVRDRADWDVRRAHILASFQEVAGPLPGGERRVPLEMKVLATFRENGLVRKKVTFAAEPGDRVPAWLLGPDDPPAPAARRPAVLCLHQTIAMGKDEPVGLGTNTDLQYAASSPIADTSHCRPITPISANTTSTSMAWATRVRP